MSRQYIGFTSRGMATLHNVRTEDGFPLMLMYDGEVRIITLDLAAMLKTGETISSATVSAEGVTASVSNTTTAATLTLTDPGAWATATVNITLSTGEKHNVTIRARENSAAYDPTDAAYAL